MRNRISITQRGVRNEKCDEEQRELPERIMTREIMLRLLAKNGGISYNVLKERRFG